MNGHHPSARESVLITGASSGIGYSTARLFAGQGYRVFGTSRQKLPNIDGVEMLVLDVRSDESVKHCVDEVLARAGQIDILINNAGIEQLGIVEETSMEDARTVFETNFFGVVRVTNAVLPGMRRRRQGRIINIGSVAAWVGEPGEGFYAASKHALAGCTEALRHEVWPFGIHVSLVEPGAFKTNVLQAASVARGVIPDYDEIRQAASRTLQDSLRKGDDPHKVAQLLLRIVQARAPHLRYGVGAEALWIPYLKILMPQRLFDYLLRRGFGLHKA